MAYGANSLGWGGSDLNGDAGIKLRTLLNDLSATPPADLKAKVNELVVAVNLINSAGPLNTRTPIAPLS